MPRRPAIKDINASMELHSPPGFCNWCVRFYSDDDGGSGYGDNPLEAVWWANAHECVIIIEEFKHYRRLPKGIRFQVPDYARKKS